MTRMTQAEADRHKARVHPIPHSKSQQKRFAMQGGEVRSARRDSPGLPGRTRSKYSAVRTQVDGIWFDSKSEAAHYRRLQLLAAAGQISDLRCHQRWPLVVNGIECAQYESDFDHLDANGTRVIVDVKGKPTEAYQLKKKLFEALYPVKILEVRKAPRGSK